MEKISAWIETLVVKLKKVGGVGLEVELRQHDSHYSQYSNIFALIRNERWKENLIVSEDDESSGSSKEEDPV